MAKKSRADNMMVFNATRSEVLVDRYFDRYPVPDESDEPPDPVGRWATCLYYIHEDHLAHTSLDKRPNDGYAIKIFRVMSVADVNELCRYFGYGLRIDWFEDMEPYLFCLDTAPVEQVVELALKMVEALSNRIGGIVACIKEDEDAVLELMKHIAATRKKPKQKQNRKPKKKR